MLFLNQAHKYMLGRLVYKKKINFNYPLFISTQPVVLTICGC